MPLFIRISILFALFLWGCVGCSSDSTVNVITPRPVSVTMQHGMLELDSPLKLSVSDQTIAPHLVNYALSMPLPCEQGTATSGDKTLRLTKNEQKDSPDVEGSYQLSITPAGVSIQSGSDVGLFYGLQSLQQLYEYYGPHIPAQEIKDAPRFAWRGMHLDVSRNFFDKEFVKKQLRMISSLKLNKLHMHLTDGAGWRIEIDRYPQLTDFAAWRQGETWFDWQKDGRRYLHRDDPNAFGGYYTKDDIRELVAYADSLYITIIPEIEFPSHSEEVLAAYPELSCSGKPYTSGEFCMGNEATFEFMENVLTEVMELFPSEYIHIGGDEASKSSWESCPKCQARMKAEGLTSTDELQSYGVNRIGRFVAAHGRKMVGWDEILDGGLSPDAVVMSWRGEEGGRAAAAAGHEVVMAPGAYCYFDGYQDNPTTEPQAFSGFLPLRKVYSYNPAPDDMPGKEKVLGVESTLWAEYISDPRQSEYMLYPRVFALAEVAWSPADRKDYDDFHRRALIRINAARKAGYNTFNLRAESGERPESLQPVEHLAVGCPVVYTSPWSEHYPAGGATALTDGLRGSWSYSTRWQGFLDRDFDVTVDLGAVKPIQEISADFIQWYSAWVWLPTRVEISVSDDGEQFKLLQTITNDYSEEEQRPEYRTFSWQGEAEGRYVQYRAFSNGRPGGWLFTDEIIVR